VVSSCLNQELKANRIVLVGSQEKAQDLGVHMSPFGVIPKKGKANKWKLILDLSSPTGQSVNDEILKEDSGLVATKIVELGKGTLMGKMDKQQAYRNILVALEDRHLLGMRWQGKVYVNKFGLRSAPIIFTAIADAQQFIMEQQGVTWLVHYLDDFLMLGQSDSFSCSKP